MILAWLLLLTGLIISAVAIYYSVIGLTAIFSAAVIPIIVMGSALEVGKLVCASWLKANWERAPAYMKYYMISAVVILMLITSMGIFGFLSKAHNDQNLVSGDVQSKIAVYDEKIKTSKDNIDANRKALKQMDEAVDQVMARSSSETGADKAVGIRRSQQKERARLQSEIQTEQKTIATLSEERAPIAAEVRKVEAEVGPIKYIAAFIYGETNEGLLEKAVTWVIILIVIVFDPLAVIMLLAAQMTFGWKKDEDEHLLHTTVPHTDTPKPVDNVDELINEVKEITPKYEPDDGPLTDEQVEQIEESVAVTNPDREPFDFSKHPYLFTPAGSQTPPGMEPVPPQVYKPEPVIEEYVKWPGGQDTLFCYKCGTQLVDAPGIGFFCPNKECDVMDNTSGSEPIEINFVPTLKPDPVVTADSTEVNANEPTYQILPELEEESKKKSYLIKQGEQQIVKTKN